MICIQFERQPLGGQSPNIIHQKSSAVLWDRKKLHPIQFSSFQWRAVRSLFFLARLTSFYVCPYHIYIYIHIIIIYIYIDIQSIYLYLSRLSSSYHHFSWSNPHVCWCTWLGFSPLHSPLGPVVARSKWLPIFSGQMMCGNCKAFNDTIHHKWNGFTTCFHFWRHFRIF